jgi:ferredoxin-type protein NapH
VWEWVNPVSLTQRALIFGGASAWGAVAAVFLFDLLVAPRGWCGHVCPVGAAYALIGHKSLLRVSAAPAAPATTAPTATPCAPSPRSSPAAEGQGGVSPVITDSECTNCGRCIDVCGPSVFPIPPASIHKRD